MNVLVIGSGGRENAIVWKLKQNPKIKEIYCSPGNGGISLLSTLIPSCAENDWNSYADFARQKNIDLTVVGPEVPLANGIVDHFQQKGLKIFGPNKNCARLESSKIFAKEFMKKHGIPTADFQWFGLPGKAYEYISKKPDQKLVVKADGLAAGKGVVVCNSRKDAEISVEMLMVQKIFGSAGERILIEERLQGDELSLMAFCDGETIRMLPPARDYKRILDQNQGPNTGGMGAIAPAPVSESVLTAIENSVVKPFLKGLKSEGLDYRGIIYFGLMLTDKGPYVLEFNVRFGDPETQVVLPLIENDLVELFDAVITQSLKNVSLKIAKGACVCLVCASGGYPGKFENHKEIFGLDQISNNLDSFVFHAGTVQENNKFYTHGGRVLNIVSRGSSIQEARGKCYQTVQKIKFENMHYRKDIGQLIDKEL